MLESEVGSVPAFMEALSMKSNRMRLSQPRIGIKDRIKAGVILGMTGSTVRLEELPAPLPITKVPPDQLIEDILISTLRRVQNSAAPEVAAAAARYITLLSEKAV
jgi:hypothetical protein